MKALDENFLLMVHVHIIAEQTSCLCKFHIQFDQRNMAVEELNTV